ncbi:ABC transporter substrate-binding protein [Paenibacillus radicis (ex Gao et al. 2016)]|uniref:ABC transporter permease n=1 Tax=Paenibacillus radicis (ex Gao et al. 2016) TaxID=1737354 RepID=A0A917M0N9_9BACL|nr:ABC transporter substrate-binding protein [Paenibacillus radicis (ex Gao et al. 2016)]GGG69056.1 ABC transporter permease [Paenibacillus radicis (ex Gao et al. 2016)]
MSKLLIQSRSYKYLLSAVLLMTLLLSACSNSSAPAATAGNGGDSSPELKKVRLIEGWYAKGEDGGYFGALQQNYYKDKGIDMTIQPGGPEVSGLQLVAAGKAEFGISYADEILKAREQGIPVVGILAGMQYTPQVLMYHKEANVTDFSDLNGKTVYVTPAIPYWEYIKSQYKLTDVKEMKYNGQLVNFINDPNSLNQGYVTNEPYVLSQQGVDVGYLKIADSGYANYANVLFTTEDYLKKHPDIVEAVVQASQKGWSYYLDNYKTVNPLIQTYNPDMTLEAMNYEAEQEKSFVLNEETKTNGIGYMTKERWDTLQKQMLQVGGLSKEQDVSKAFTGEFLAKS